MPKVIDIENAEQFNKFISDGAIKITFVDFSAIWCGPCKEISPYFEELANQYPNAHYVKVDVNKNKDIAAEYEIRAMPTFLVFIEGKQKDKLVGADNAGLKQMIEKHHAK